MSALKRPGIWDKGPSIPQGEPSSSLDNTSSQVLENLSTEELKNLDTKEPKVLSTTVSKDSSSEDFKDSSTKVLDNSDTEELKNSSTEIPKSSSTEELENQDTDGPKVYSTKDSKNLSTQVLPKRQKNNRSKDETKPVRKQASVHLSGATLKALHLFAYEEGLEKSEVMEKALRKFIPKKYFG